MVQAVCASATPTRPGRGIDNEEVRRQIAPMTYVSADAPPFLLVHEESDRTVNMSNSDDFVKAMKDAGAKDVAYMRLTDGSGHAAFNRNLETTGPAREAFFDRVLRQSR